MAIPTIEKLLPIITQRRPDLTEEQKSAVALRAINIYMANETATWMTYKLAVNMALFEPAS